MAKKKTVIIVGGAGNKPKTKREVMLEELKKREQERREQEQAQKTIRLSRVIVKNLFDNNLNYDIDFENGHNISILIAPNGCGKTTIFTIINFIFNGRYEDYCKVKDIPFDSVSCILSNGKKIELISKNNSHSNAFNMRISAYSNALSRTGKGYFSDLYEDLRREQSMILRVDGYEDTLNLAEEVDYILGKYNQDTLSAKNRTIVERLIAQGFEKEISLPTIIKSYLEKKDCLLEVNYISADRLHISDLKKEIASEAIQKSIDGFKGDDNNKSPLQQAKDRIKQEYGKVKDEYNIRQGIAREKLPLTYWNIDSPKLSKDEFLADWNKYIEDLEKYEEIGLIDAVDDILSTEEIVEKYEQKGAFLNVYLDLYKDTLVPLSEVYKKFKLFVDIINKRNRITKKYIKYSNEGINLYVQKNTEDVILPLECLSSGEKNDFMMFYRLIFESDNNGLVLIDEPEISLHIEWQESFLDSLVEICELNELQSVVATHSPNIVCGHGELYAEKGIEI